MRFQAYTLIEGLVSMVIIGLLLSIGGAISFNLYKSLPRNENLRMQGLLKHQMDSIEQLGTLKEMNFIYSGYLVDFEMETWNESEHLVLGRLTISDTLGNQEILERVLASYHETEDYED